MGSAGGWLLAVIVVTVLAAYATAGWLRRRFEASHPGEYPLFTQLVGDDPLLTAAVFGGTAAGYAVVLFVIRFVATRALRRHGGATPSPGRAAVAVEWAFAAWWRLALVLVVLWSPLLVLRWPGAVNPDFALMVTEITTARSEYAPDAFKPYDVYPIAYSLIPEGDLLWSNHHNAFLTLLYGLVTGASGVLLHSYIPAIVVLASSQAAFTIFALARALQLLGRHVAKSWPKAVALALTVGCVMTPLWSMDLSKNPLFAAAFVWWFGLVVHAVLSRDAVRRGWVWEIAIATTVMIVSAKFAVYIAVVGALFLVFRRRGWLGVVLGMLLPVLVFQIVLRGLIGLGVVISDDPVEARVLQLQQVALTLREHPNALNDDERAEVEKIFDIEQMTKVYNPENADPVKSSGYEENGSYRWRTVRQEDWSGFTEIWAKLAARHPDTYLNALLLKSDRYLDPLARAYPWPPLAALDWQLSYTFDLTGVNDAGRAALQTGLADVYESPFRYLISPSIWAIFTILVSAAAITLRRPGVLAWTVPLALQAGVAILSPLNGSGRYLLGLTYSAGLVVLALLAQRGDAAGETEPSGDGADDLLQTDAASPVTDVAAPPAFPAEEAPLRKGFSPASNAAAMP
ncbi:DUF6020 family protein [Microbacterium sp. Marseille-Q6965]|uniref:DUF6020 family protein n=1 Tax=Microbacterium sp. Marseille-Q6965 TaxID=2965072 RepID=UPI0021B709B2|nr:DUF6020 family protein [Microbacterium sp. Marseille-Q6965]